MIRKIFDQAEFKIFKCKGISAPFPVAIGDKWLSRLCLALKQGLIELPPRLFSYHIFLVAVPLPTLDDLLRNIAGTMIKSEGKIKIIEKK